MSAVRRVISVSALLALVSFVGVMVLSPVPERDRRSNFVPASVEDQALRMRRALIEGRHEAARRVAEETARLFAAEPDAWLWKARVHHMLGEPASARQAGERLHAMLQEDGVPESVLAQAGWSYRMGWAEWVLSRKEVARTHFASAAGLLADERPDGLSEGMRLARLAGLWAMAGETDRAAETFAQAVDMGYMGEGGWWRLNPDLSPLREHRVFLDTGVVLTRLEEERERRRQERLGGGPVRVFEEREPGDDPAEDTGPGADENPGENPDRGPEDGSAGPGAGS